MSSHNDWEDYENDITVQTRTGWKTLALIAAIMLFFIVFGFAAHADEACKQTLEQARQAFESDGNQFQTTTDKTVILNMAQEIAAGTKKDVPFDIKAVKTMAVGTFHYQGQLVWSIGFFNDQDCIIGSAIMFQHPTSLEQGQSA